MSLNAAVSNPTVVDFSTSAATAPRRSAGIETTHPDAALIKACINFAVAVRGASGAFEADPTADNDFARRMDVVLLRRAEKQQNLIASLRPTTLDGLRAKAAAADMALTFDLDTSANLLSSLCTDIAKFHRASKNTSAIV
ncbi:hypothetical protein Nham_3360 [Nitrobacter hamburgensis X14]|uniref:Uncharacterized protein n=1 Tax=Nitrobacter hamburgensis (strain DSM 10229 / NCIMB 13809 / X14) TaxID=323097 RepID=Q1QI56_NITHX|nr:hypothetical protein [Nitrobacter hamburgensis]ABE64091.1 hypothetical protein Nham_3360 [Nitrobacter hamburgensis X14]